MRLSVWRWLAPVPAAFILLGVCGLLFSNGVFVSAVHDPSFTQAIGLLACLTSLGVTLFGTLLHYASNPILYRCAPRLIAVLGSVAMASQVLFAYALHNNLRSLLYVVATVAGAGTGAAYVVPIILLQEWIPESPGVATGAGLLVSGAGSLFGIYAYQKLVDAVDVLPAIAVAGALSGLIALVSSLLLQRPPSGWSPSVETLYDTLPTHRHDTSTKQESVDMDCVVVDNNGEPSTANSLRPDEARPLLSHKEKTPTLDTRLSVYDILVDPVFVFVFVSVLAAVGPGFGLALGFPRMMHTLFGLQHDHANQLFFWVTSAGVVGRLLIGTAIDLIQSPADASSHGFSGAKRMSSTMLAVQCTAVAIMPLCIRNGWVYAFTIASGLMYLTLSGGAVIAACLARSIFAPENATLSFALLGVAMGMGRGLFSMIVASCGGREALLIVEELSNRPLYAYDAFVHAAFLISALGLISSYFLAPSKKVYQNGTNSPVFADL